MDSFKEDVGGIFGWTNSVAAWVPQGFIHIDAGYSVTVRIRVFMSQCSSSFKR